MKLTLKAILLPAVGRLENQVDVGIVSFPGIATIDSQTPPGQRDADEKVSVRQVKVFADTRDGIVTRGFGIRAVRRRKAALEPGTEDVQNFINTPVMNIPSARRRNRIPVLAAPSGDVGPGQPVRHRGHKPQTGVVVTKAGAARRLDKQ